MALPSPLHRLFPHLRACRHGFARPWRLRDHQRSHGRQHRRHQLSPPAGKCVSASSISLGQRANCRLSVAIYVVAGGLRATFIVDFLHTVILFVILYIFLFSIYGTSDVVGSPGAMYDLLKKAADLAPVAGNAAGSYVTMKSNGGILFGGCTIGAFCTGCSTSPTRHVTDSSPHPQLLASRV